MFKIWRPAHLTRQQLQERRQAAAQRFPRIAAGRLSQAALARELGVVRSAVHDWYWKWQRGGLHALHRRCGAGRPPRLNRSQWKQVKKLIRQGALAGGFPTEQWTLQRLAHLIRKELGVTYHYRYLARALQAHRITLQLPVPQAREREEALVRAFLQHDWPALKKRLVESGAVLPSWTRQVTRFGPA